MVIKRRKKLVVKKGKSTEKTTTKRKGNNKKTGEKTKVKGKGKSPRINKDNFPMLPVKFPLDIFALYKGTKYLVKMFGADLYEYDKNRYTSPSGLASIICGSQVNGWRFFKLNYEGKDYYIEVLRKGISDETLVRAKPKRQKKEDDTKVITLPDVGLPKRNSRHGSALYCVNESKFTRWGIFYAFLHTDGTLGVIKFNKKGEITDKKELGKFNNWSECQDKIAEVCKKEKLIAVKPKFETKVKKTSKTTDGKKRTSRKVVRK